MSKPILKKTKPCWRIIVAGADDVAQHLRKAGHRVLSLLELASTGARCADAAVLEFGHATEGSSARTFRSKLLEPILIHQRRTERSPVFLSLMRADSGKLDLALLDELVAHAVERTRLLRRLDAESAELDAPTERVTMQLPVQLPKMEMTMVLPRPRGQRGE